MTEEGAIVHITHDWLLVLARARLSGDRLQIDGMSPRRDEKAC